MEYKISFKKKMTPFKTELVSREVGENQNCWAKKIHRDGIQKKIGP